MSEIIPHNSTVVIAAHGAPATNYPAWRVGLLMALEFSGLAVERIGFLRGWRERLDHEVRAWPRTAANDPYKAAVDELAARLAARIGWRTLVGYNEFCAPTIAEAIDHAVAEGAAQIIVAPTMLLRGNQHTEAEISAIVAESRKRHPLAVIRYAWPFDDDRVVSLFVEHILANGEKC